jgi:uncharacterized coiled-coil DUF342 family protein
LLLGRAGALITEAVDVGLLAEPPQTIDLNAARDILRQVLNSSHDRAEAADLGGEFERLRHRRSEINDGLREIADQLRSLDDFAAVETSYIGELSEQHARLSTIGLVPDNNAESTCTLCGQLLGDQSSPSHQAITQALARAGRRLELAQRDRPRIQEARSALLDRRLALRSEATDADQSLDALASQDELVSQYRETINVQSYVRGRVALYLDATGEVDDEQLEELRACLETRDRGGPGLVR